MTQEIERLTKRVPTAIPEAPEFDASASAAEREHPSAPAHRNWWGRQKVSGQVEDVLQVVLVRVILGAVIVAGIDAAADNMKNDWRYPVAKVVLEADAPGG